jgi:hypothetical protein
MEDYHALRILYRGSIADRGAPAVQEVNGTTDAAAWVPLADLTRLRLAGLVGFALGHLG